MIAFLSCSSNKHAHTHDPFFPMKVITNVNTTSINNPSSATKKRKIEFAEPIASSFTIYSTDEPLSQTNNKDHKFSPLRPLPRPSLKIRHRVEIVTQNSDSEEEMDSSYNIITSNNTIGNALGTPCDLYYSPYIFHDFNVCKCMGISRKKNNSLISAESSFSWLGYSSDSYMKFLYPHGIGKSYFKSSWTWTNDSANDWVKAAQLLVLSKYFKTNYDEEVIINFGPKQFLRSFNKRLRKNLKRVLGQLVVYFRTESVVCLSSPVFYYTAKDIYLGFKQMWIYIQLHRLDMALFFATNGKERIGDLYWGLNDVALTNVLGEGYHGFHDHLSFHDYHDGSTYLYDFLKIKKKYMDFTSFNVFNGYVGVATPPKSFVSFSSKIRRIHKLIMIFCLFHNKLFMKSFYFTFKDLKKVYCPFHFFLLLNNKLVLLPNGDQIPLYIFLGFQFWMGTPKKRLYHNCTVGITTDKHLFIEE
ncbi:hypothetical protein MOUN0_J00144 [Monosporozyma unispora]